MLPTSKQEIINAYIDALQRAYANIIHSYIWDTFDSCTKNPKNILHWRLVTAQTLFRHACTDNLLYITPQKDINDFLGIASDIFYEHIDESAEKDRKRNIFKEIDRQLCNYIRNELALPDEDEEGYPLGYFSGMSKTEKQAIMDELNRPFEDCYKKAKR